MLFLQLLHTHKLTWHAGVLASAIPNARSSFATSVSSMPTPSELEMGEIKPFSEIPGPKPLPIIHNLLEVKKNSSRMLFYLEDCCKNYGEIFKLQVPGQY